MGHVPTCKSLKLGVHLQEVAPFLPKGILKERQRSRTLKGKIELRVQEAIGGGAIRLIDSEGDCIRRNV